MAPARCDHPDKPGSITMAKLSGLSQRLTCMLSPDGATIVVPPSNLGGRRDHPNIPARMKRA
jgi:hypothetical protein